MARLNATHDPALRSWVESANAPGTGFIEPAPAWPRGRTDDA